jgi:hypothetical protein
LLLQALSLLYQRIHAKHLANPVAMHSWQLAVQCLCERIAAVGAASPSRGTGHIFIGGGLADVAPRTLR